MEMMTCARVLGETTDLELFVCLLIQERICSELCLLLRVTTLVLFHRKDFVQDSSELTLLHSERPKLYTILAFLSAVGLTCIHFYIQFWPF